MENNMTTQITKGFLLILNFNSEIPSGEIHCNLEVTWITITKFNKFKEKFFLPFRLNNLNMLKCQLFSFIMVKMKNIWEFLLVNKKNTFNFTSDK